LGLAPNENPAVGAAPENKIIDVIFTTSVYVVLYFFKPCSKSLFARVEEGVGSTLRWDDRPMASGQTGALWPKIKEMLRKLLHKFSFRIIPCSG
jgi:hypothetical protein